jgi:hypothetical protein
MAWLTSPAQVVEPQNQSISFKVQLHSAFLSNFTVREASDSNVRPFGVRLMASDYDRLLWEVGFHAYGNYGDVARASIGISFAYLFAELRSHNFKIGFSLSKIELEDVDIDQPGIGASVGDVRFDGTGDEFKPYVEWEWIFSRFSSLFIQTGYRIINGERSVVTAVEEVDGRFVERRATDRDHNFFYSASGFEVGVGLSINF